MDSNLHHLKNEAAVAKVIAHVRSLLPPQNPLTFFIHNNLLQPFENESFYEGIGKASEVYRARPLLQISEYISTFENLPLPEIEYDQAELASLVGKSKAFLDQVYENQLASFSTCRSAAAWEQQTGEAFSRIVHDWIIPFIASYMDQGLSISNNPFQSATLIDAFAEMLTLTPAWIRPGGDGLKRRAHEHLQRCKSGSVSSLQSLILELESREVPTEDFESLITELIFDLKGWSTLISTLERDPELAPVFPSKATFIDWLLMRVWVEHSVHEAMESKYSPRPYQKTAPSRQHQLAMTEMRELQQAWHTLYEKIHYQPFLKKLQARFANAAAGKQRNRKIAVLVCMDDREESLRRHIEDISADIETFGVLGFFGLDMKFHAFGERVPRRQCPPVVEPRRHVTEALVDTGKNSFHVRDQAYSWARMHIFYRTRSVFRGAFYSISFGHFSILPLVARLIFPNFTDRLRKKIQNVTHQKPPTRLVIDSPLGYSVEDQAGRVEELLRGAGLLDNWPRVVAVLAHGSSNTNNPFRQAYGCGACSGNSGEINAKVICEMANSKLVRAELSKRGLHIPEATHFFPGLHDTSADTISLHTEVGNTEFGSETQSHLAELRAVFDQALIRNAEERCRQLGEPFHQLTGQAAIQSVRARGLDLAEPRPELGHSGVLACILARRDMTESLDLQRRAFLVSYDKNTDIDGASLRGLAGGAVPVAANISLDYFFGRVDAKGFGAGSKLPLNVTSLLGVMTGSKSDLRVGMAQQMSDYHTPVRPLVVFDADPKLLIQTLTDHKRLARLIENDWIWALWWNADSKRFERYKSGGFTEWTF